MAKRILLGTRKGTVIVEQKDGHWSAKNIAHAGIPVCYVACDKRDGTLWASLDHGHWGPKLSRSKDGGETWQDVLSLKYPEGARYIVKYLPTEDFDPDAPAKDPEYKDATVYKIWNLTFGTAEQPGRIYAGTIPGGLFVSDDAGESWQLNRSLWNHESRGGNLFDGDATSENKWFGTPASINYGVFEPGIHSIIINPQNPDRLYMAASSVGVMQSTDGGKSWTSANKGMLMDYLPNPEAEWGHDPHYVTACASQPEHMWQQNHCGVFYSDNGAKNWRKVSSVKDGVHFGFPIAADNKNGLCAWVVPARADSERMALDGGLFVARTEDGGQTWQKFNQGLPQQNAYDIVYRHALDAADDMVCFASTTGNLYLSEDRGETWQCLGNNFPPVYSVRFA
ncbi:BNR repeat-containing protein [Catenovulum agarivorans DS-2]|uniref:BNR repeat-containing protein n=1 Tax=Catenovulum agarivorans DS-2 TaxID=1328313 RepID=W7QKP0_9ALTE|nr:sialidase family protein [Catenovulum agarivorans]EWH09527.1 BNR repeat-containing protein [Catenovulum agarivorans DS-2]